VIRPNDFVEHIPSDELWCVCGVDYKRGELIPCGWPFPTIAKISDCRLVESRDMPQEEGMKEALVKEGLSSFVESEVNA